MKHKKVNNKAECICGWKMKPKIQTCYVCNCSLADDVGHYRLEYLGEKFNLCGSHMQGIKITLRNMRDNFMLQNGNL